MSNCNAGRVHENPLFEQEPLVDTNAFVDIISGGMERTAADFVPVSRPHAGFFSSRLDIASCPKMGGSRVSWSGVVWFLFCVRGGVPLVRNISKGVQEHTRICRILAKLLRSCFPPRQASDGHRIESNHSLTF